MLRRRPLARIAYTATAVSSLAPTAATHMTYWRSSAQRYSAWQINSIDLGAGAKTRTSRIQACIIRRTHPYKAVSCVLRTHRIVIRQSSFVGLIDPCVLDFVRPCGPGPSPAVPRLIYTGAEPTDKSTPARKVPDEERISTGADQRHRGARWRRGRRPTSRSVAWERRQSHWLDSSRSHGRPCGKKALNGI